MSLRPAELAEVIAELSAALTGAFVQKVWSPSPQRLYLAFRQPARTTLVLLSTEPQLSRLSVVEERPTGAPDDTGGRQRFFRTELAGHRLAEVSQIGPSVVALGFKKDESECWVVGELGAGARIRVERERPPGASPGLDSTQTSSRLAPGDSPFARALAAEALLAARDGAQDEQARRRRLLGPLVARRKQLERTVGKVTQEAQRQGAAEEHRRLGELLGQQLARVPRGAKEVELTEYTPEGKREVLVPLEPALSPREQVERHFRQYRRLLRGAERAAQRLVELSDEQAGLERRIRHIEEMDRATLLAESTAPTAVRRKGPDKHRPFREYRSASGTPIWVGRGGLDNDSLTFHVARPEHWWLHARGVTGAHVVVPLARGEELPPEVLLDAAHLALHHSSRKGELQAEVSYTRVKFVRKVKGGAAGQVSYTRERTFWLRVEPARLERLLASREEIVRG